MHRMGRRKLRFDVQKNSERRRRLCKAVTCALTIPNVFSIRLPIATAYLPSRVSSLGMLHERVTKLRALPAGWTSSIISGQLVLVKFWSGQVPTVLYMVTIMDDFAWTVRRGENMVSKKGDVFTGAPCLLQSVESITDVLSRLDHCKLCIGNSDEKFSDLIAWRGGTFMDQSGMNLTMHTVICCY